MLLKRPEAFKHKCGRPAIRIGPKTPSTGTWKWSEFMVHSFISTIWLPTSLSLLPPAAPSVQHRVGCCCHTIRTRLVLSFSGFTSSDGPGNVDGAGANNGIPGPVRHMVMLSGSALLHSTRPRL